MIDTIKKHIPENIKGQILSMLQPAKVTELEKYRGKKKILVFLAGYYQNLGDMALTYSQKCFLEENFPDYEVIMIPSTKTYTYMKALKRLCTEEDIITTIGGGNMDDIYISLEDCRRFVIKSFPNNRIVSFPQTMVFSETPFGQKRLQKTTKIYNKHKNLKIFTREKRSLARMQKSFVNDNIGFCPDMVLYLNKIEPQLQRQGVLCCLREDKEMQLSGEQNLAIKSMLQETYDSVTFTDTVNVTLEQCRPENIETTLHSFWDSLKSSKVVLTDRLHCMIFCAITKTPCVVLDNTNKKISGVFQEWLSDLGYIRMIENNNDVDLMKKEIDNLYAIKLEDYPNINLKSKFKPLIEALQK